MSKSTMWSIAGGVVILAAVVMLIIFVPASKNKNSNNTVSKVANTSANKGANSTTKTNKSTSQSASQQATETSTIKANYTNFFAKNTSMQQRQTLLQNGSEFAQPMQNVFQQLGSDNPSVTINSVTLKNNSTANVNYTVYLNGQPVLKDQVGGAVLVNNVWQVSDATICQLFSLGGQSPSVCNNVH